MTCSVIDMLHLTRRVHVDMNGHAMTFALRLCMRHHVESGEYMVRVDTVFGI